MGSLTATRAPAPAPSPPPGVPIVYQQLPTQWAPVEEPWLDRMTRTDLRLAVTLSVAGFVAVFVKQVPVGGQIVFGAPLFEEFLKVGVALLPWAALGVRSLWLRLPTAGLVGAGFGVLEHYVSYSTEPQAFLFGRMLFHGLTAGLSMAVLHGLQGTDRRLLLLCTMPSTFLHAANNSAAVSLALATFVLPLDDAAIEKISLSVAGGFLAVLALQCLTWPFWMPRYRAFVHRWALPRLRPPGSAIPATPSTSSRS